MPPVFAAANTALQVQVEQALAAAFPVPTPAGSWVDYKCSVRVEEDHGVVTGRLLPQNPIEGKDRKPAWDASAEQFPAGQSRGGVLFPPADDYKIKGQGPGQRGNTVFYQRRVEPEVYAFLEGWALRVAFPIPCPELTDINGVAVVNANRLDRGEGFTCWIVGHAGHPVYKAMWRLRYLVAGNPFKGDLPVPPNPLTG